ncbi:MAG TPA: DinB family protein [Gemmatimonadales bacterium]|nr:DinB family protein [Gemmatimonadales bacterium]
MPAAIARPAPEEYAPYFGRYVDRVPADVADPLALLRTQLETTPALFERVGEAGATYRYAPGKWSIKEILGHLAETERIFGYRALAFARGETQPLPGFDEDAYTAAGRFDARPLADLVEEYRAVRRATLALFRGLDAEALAFVGTASGGPMSARALAWIIPGHELHHLETLRTRYGVGEGAKVA